jgi:hypothetical protein
MHTKLVEHFPAIRFQRSISALLFIFGLNVSSMTPSKAEDVETSQITKIVADLIEKGRKHDAASFLYDLVRDKNGESFHCQFGTIRACTQLAKQHELLGEIIRVKSPPADATFAAVKDFTITLVHFTSPGSQREALAKLHADRPRDPRVLTLLTIATPSDQLDPMIEQATRLNPSGISEFLKMLTDEMRPYYKNEGEFMRDAALVQWLAKLFAALPPQDYLKADFISVSHLAKDRCRFSTVGDIEIIPLYIEHHADQQKADIAQQDFVRKICDTRDRALENLADSLLKHPSISAVGFNILHRGRSSFPVSNQRLYEASLTAIHSQLRTYRHGHDFLSLGRFTRLSNLCNHNYPIMYFGVEFDPFPDDFAAAYAKEHRISAVPATLLEGVDPTLSPSVRGWLAFLEQPAPALLPGLLANLQSEPSSHIAFKIAVMLLEGTSQDVEKGFNLILDHYDFTPLLQTRPWGGGFRSTARDFEKIIGRHYVRHPDHVVASAGLRRIATRLLGPAETWPAYKDVDIENENTAATFGTNDTRSAKLSAFAYITNHRSQEGRIRPNYNLLRFVNTHELPEGIESADNAESIYNYQAVPVLLPEVMLPSNLLVAGPGMFDQKGRFIPPLLVRTSDPEDFKRFGEGLLKVRGPQGFWSTITGALWTQRDAAFVLPSLEQELPMIRSWSASQQNHFAKFLVKTWPPLRDTSLKTWLNSCANK